MPKYYNTENGIIVDYPEEAAALFPVLKPVPSERAEKKTEAPAPEPAPKVQEEKQVSVEQPKVDSKTTSKKVS